MSGCSTGATRSLWSQRWMEPSGNAVLADAQDAAEITGKAIATPVTAAIDVVTDDATLVLVETVAKMFGAVGR